MKTKLLFAELLRCKFCTANTHYSVWDKETCYITSVSTTVMYTDDV